MIFYIDVPDDTVADRKLADLLTALENNFDVTTTDCVRVDTSEAHLLPLLSKLAAVTVPEDQDAPAPQAEAKPQAGLTCPECGQPSKTGKRCRRCAAKAGWPRKDDDPPASAPEKKLQQSDNFKVYGADMSAVSAAGGLKGKKL